MTPPPPLAISGVDTHAHVFLHSLPMATTRRYSPSNDATPQQYLTELDRHHLSHGVLIQPSFLGTNNSYLLEALRQHPQRLRGIAVVDTDIDDAALDVLDAAGIRGIRLNLIGKPLEDYAGTHWQALLRRLAQRGWQVEIQRDFEDLAAIVPSLMAAGVDVVIDHFGLPRHGIDPLLPGHHAVLQMLADSPRLWVKLSAPYRSGSDLIRAHAALAQLRQACNGCQRLLWGSDWPHTQHESSVTYGQQYAFFEALLPDPSERRQILVDNPARLFRLASH